MRIDLTKIKSFYLTCEKARARQGEMEAMLSNLGINCQKVDGRLTDPYTIGVAESHLNCLKESWDEPVLIFEDDARVLSGYKSIIDIPDYADALYIGTSLYGMNFGRNQFGGVVARDEGEYLRVFNELSLHAVIYLSLEYREKVIRILEKFDPAYAFGVDGGIAAAMPDSYVLAVKQPMFYQDDGHSYEATATPITPCF